MRGIRIFVPVLVAIIVVGGLALQRAEPQAPKEVLIGVLLPLTGNFASLGQQYLWANQTVEDIVNNDYADLAVPLGPGKGFSGLGGATMKLVVRDDQSRGDLARSLVEQLITVNKVHWVDGEGTSGNTSIIQPVVEGYGIPLSCHACASPTLTDKGFKWFWRTGPHDRLMVDSVFRFLQEWPKNGGPTDLKTVAVFTCDNLFCQDNHKIALEHAAKAGFKVVADLTTKTGATTLASEVQRLQSANPDILFFVQYPAESAVFQADAKRAGLDAQGDRHQQRLLFRPDLARGAEEDQRRGGVAGAGPDGHRPRQQEAVLEKGERDLQEVQPGAGHGRAGDAPDHRYALGGGHDQPGQVGRARRPRQGGRRHQHDPGPDDHRLQGHPLRQEQPERAGQRRGDPDRLGRREAHDLAVGSRQASRVHAGVSEPELAGAGREAQAAK
jgi:hypothetical protein